LHRGAIIAEVIGNGGSARWPDLDAEVLSVTYQPMSE